MASPGHEYTLVGFSEEVDRRPLIFVEPLPSAKVCSACGLVQKAIALHECEHYFCKACYEQCLRRGDVVCPLHGQACLEDEITWINYKTRTVMTKKVLCWNHRNGCNVVTAAADISRHFHYECGHHSTLTGRSLTRRRTIETALRVRSQPLKSDRFCKFCFNE